MSNNLDDDAYICSLRAFWALRYAELYLLAFIQGFVATWVIDALKVYENIGAWFLLDKAEAFVRIKPFNGASSDCRHDESYKYKVIKPLRRVKQVNMEITKWKTGRGTTEETSKW